VSLPSLPSLLEKNLLKKARLSTLTVYEMHGAIPMKSLVTGGLGFIGEHLVRLLIERGETVRVLDIDERRPENLDAEVIRGSVCDPETVHRALQGVERLYHLAANPNLWARDKSVFAKVNHEGTRTVLEQASQFDLQRIVHTSTESILAGSRARHRGPEPAILDGSHWLVLEKMPGPYCRSKFLAEQEALAAAARGQPVVIVSPTMPIGPGDHKLTPPTRMLLGFVTGRIPAYLNCGMNLVDVRDVALGHLLAAERGRTGERYVLGGHNLMLKDLLTLIAQITGIRTPRVQVPYWLALGFSVLSEFVADTITHRAPTAPKTGVILASSPMFFDCSKAVNELGLTQTPLRNAVEDAIRWLVQTGHVRRRLAVGSEA
jgi:dihydroflavonol-4-reductase